MKAVQQETKVVLPLQLRPSAHHATFGGGRFGWWEGTLRRRARDYWTCHHQHENRARALACVEELVRALGGMVDPIVWREDPSR